MAPRFCRSLSRYGNSRLGMGAFSMAKMANRGAVLPLSVFGDCALATFGRDGF